MDTSALVSVEEYLKAREQIIRTPPFLVIEVLSPDDRVGELQEKIDDGSHDCKDGVMGTENPGIEVPLAEVLPPISSSR